MCVTVIPYHFTPVSSACLHSQFLKPGNISIQVSVYLIDYTRQSACCERRATRLALACRRERNFIKSPLQLAGMKDI